MENLPIGPTEMRSSAPVRILFPGERTAIPIFLDEWEALVRRIESCKVSLQPWSIAYSVAFAVGVTAGLSIAPIGFGDLPSWVTTAYIVICALGLAIGSICVIAERTLAKTQHTQVNDLIDHMERMKQLFSDPAAQQQE